MNPVIYEKFANLLLEVGIGMKEGQCIEVYAEPIHWEFVNILERMAYEKGARFVRTELNHAQGLINRCNHRKKEYMNYVPPYAKAMVQGYVEEEWSTIRFGGPEDPDLLKQLDQTSNAIIQKALLEISKPQRFAFVDGRCSACSSALPTPKWAAQILGGEANQEAVNKLWELFIPILRLDQDDPVQAWIDFSKHTYDRRVMLQEMQLQTLRFTGPGTNLLIGIPLNVKWFGGGLNEFGDRYFIPNLPTEEVFTIPNKYKTQGRVQVTRPVAVLGDHVKDAWFEFKDGEVVDYGASYGKHLLKNYFDIDPNAKYLGEVALVDISSPIYKSGKIFHNIIFDENASCHIALGNGMKSLWPESSGKSEDEIDALGCNVSIVHTDFMIGSEKVSIEGTLANGEKIQIMRNGEFQI